MSQGQAPKPVKSGPPLWLWMMLVVVTVLVTGGVIITSIPDDPEELFANAQAAIDDREGKEAFDDNLARLRRFPEYASHVALLQGMLETKMNRDVKAMQYLKEAAAGNDAIKPRVLQAMGASFLKLGKHQEAIEAYEDAISTDPSLETSVRISLARLYATVGAFGLAVDTLNEVLVADENDRDALMMRAVMRKELRQYELALSDFEAILQTPGDRAAASPDTIRSCGECLCKVGTPEKAKWFLDNCDFDPNDRGMVAPLLLMVGDLESLNEGFQQLMGQEGAAAPIQRMFARVRLAEGDLDEAVGNIRTALNTNPRERESLEVAREIYEQKGDSAMVQILDENLQEIAKLEAKLFDAFERAGRNISDGDSRVEAAQMLHELGDYNGMTRWYYFAGQADATKLTVVRDGMEAASSELTMLVPFPDSYQHGHAKEGNGSEVSPGTGLNSPTRENAGDEAATDEAATDEAAADEAAADEAATDEAATDEAATDEAATDEAATDEAATDEAATDEAATDEAATDEAATDEAATDEAAAE